MDLKITTKMSGKMTNMVSINTSSLNNNYCVAMAKQNDKICAKCYSNQLLKMYKTADKRFQLNGQYLSSRIHESDYLPRINASVVRFNAYGELINYEHLVNLFNICSKNKTTTFTLWTKRDDLVAKAVRDWGKPKNLILVYSSLNMNVRAAMPKHFNKVFTVYDDKKPASVKINCGKTKCFECMKCYTIGNKTKYINEMVK
jgi:hypothetical protein